MDPCCFKKEKKREIDLVIILVRKLGKKGRVCEENIQSLKVLDE
jgi:hypothetical protein